MEQSLMFKVWKHKTREPGPPCNSMPAVNGTLRVSQKMEGLTKILFMGLQSLNLFDKYVTGSNAVLKRTRDK